jgi:thiamine biosynthesis protein ThiS
MILVNNRDKIEWQKGMTVTGLLHACRYTSPKIAVFVNDEYVHRKFYDVYRIDDDASVRVLHLIGGG